MRPLLILLMALLPLPLGAQTHTQAVSHDAALRALTPPEGKLWFGGFVGRQIGVYQDIEVVQETEITQYEALLGHRLAWVYFSDNWFLSRRFPAGQAVWIRDHGAVPFVRLMLRSDDRPSHGEALFTPAAIARGDFDADLVKWMRDAATFATPLLAEYGTEVNGEWFAWNGLWHGQAQGAADFAAAYRHIIDLARENGATNIVWVFHVNHVDDPDEDWNRFENYYPGDDWIDWIGVSAYGTLSPYETYVVALTDIDWTMERIARMAPDKPVILAETGTDVRNPHAPAARWAEAAFDAILSNRWPQLTGFTWWNEYWENGDDPARATDLRVRSNPDLVAVFRRALQDPRIAP